MKKGYLIFAIFGIMLLMVATVSVNAASTTKTLNSSNPSTSPLEGGKMGERFYTSVRATSLPNGSPTIMTQAGRKMFGIVWYDSGKGYSYPTSVGTTYTLSWDANGTWETRATWENYTSSAPITAVFSLYD